MFARLKASRVSLLPKESSFHERVQDCFAAYRGRGVMLSALDVELLDSWAKKDVPFEVVARGMRSAAEGALYDAAQGDAGLRSLAACRKKVDAEIKKYFGRAAGGTRSDDETVTATDPLHLARFKKLKALVKKVGREHEELEKGTERLLRGLSAPADYVASARQEELAFTALVRALSWPRRHALLREARSLVQKVGVLSPGARQEATRFHRTALLKRELGLPR